VTVAPSDIRAALQPVNAETIQADVNGAEVKHLMVDSPHEAFTVRVRARKGK